MTMKKEELMKLVGARVCVEFNDGGQVEGTLGFTKDFSALYGYRKPGCFTVGAYDFKVSHIKKVTEVGHEQCSFTRL